MIVEMIPIPHDFDLLLLLFGVTRQQIRRQVGSVRSRPQGRNDNVGGVFVAPRLAAMRIVRFGCDELNVAHVHASFPGSVEGDDPIVALGLVLGAEVVGSIGHLDGEGACFGICLVYCNFSHLKL
jgi:hypothetical protein